MRTQIIILAAGNSTRMKSEMPKVLMKIGNQTMIERVVETARAVVPDALPIVVVNERNRDAIARALEDRAKLVIQREQLGTAHAVQSAKGLVEPDVKQVVVLYGDHPFIKKETIQQLVHARGSGQLAMVTFSTKEGDHLHEMLKDFGRIIRDSYGKVIGIREVKDASLEELAIAEKNPGYYCFHVPWLWENLERLENKNAQREYYLTDLVARAVARGYEIVTVEPEDVIECMGINNPEQLAWVRDHAVDRIRDRVYIPTMEEGEKQKSDELWKKEVGKGLIVLANVVGGGLVFGQFLNDNINKVAFGIGFIGTIVFYFGGALFIKKSRL